MPVVKQLRNLKQTYRRFSRRYTSQIIIAILALAVIAVALVSLDIKPSTDTTSFQASQVCGRHTVVPVRYEHIIWILEENRDFDMVHGSPQAPYFNNLARQCSYTASFYDNEPRQNLGPGYHSLSHYVADVSGSNCVVGNGRGGSQCIYLDARSPHGYSLPTMSLFEQIQNAGLSWKSYQESATKNCDMGGGYGYVPRHDAVLYFSHLRAACRQNDQPIPSFDDTPTGALIDDINHDTLPTFAYITPNLTHDMHDGGVGQGDAWLRAYLEPLLSSRAYAEGNTAVFIIWDEATTADDMLPNLVIAPTAKPGPINVSANGFAVLRATEQMLGLPTLGCANGTAPGDSGQCYPGATTDLRRAYGI